MSTPSLVQRTHKPKDPSRRATSSSREKYHSAQRRGQNARPRHQSETTPTEHNPPETSRNQQLTITQTDESVVHKPCVTAIAQGSQYLLLSTSINSEPHSLHTIETPTRLNKTTAQFNFCNQKNGHKSCAKGSMSLVPKQVQKHAVPQ